jgi:hypothetical protein
MFLEVRFRVVILSCILLLGSACRCFGWSIQPTEKNGHVNSSFDYGVRRCLFRSLIQSSSMVGLILTTGTPPTRASNLPESTGADTTKVGTVEALIPIVALRASLARLESTLAKVNGPVLQTDGTIPKDEKEFKRLFDSYSDPVSYKQKFLDQNAFLVYYTKGFDGPGRDNIEAEINERQTVQFGLRNEAWIAWENFLVELKFIQEQDNDCASYLSSTLRAVDSYLALVPVEDLKAAKEKLEFLGRQAVVLL